MKILCVGEMMVDIIVQGIQDVAFENGSAGVSGIRVASGGDAANNAIGLSRLGNDVKYVGLVGNDVLAEHALSLVAASGADVSHTVRSADTPHAKTVILINNDKNRMFLQHPGTSAEFSLEHVDLSLLDWADILQIGGTFHLPKFDGEGAATLLRMAQEKGVITSMDVTSDRSGRWNEIIEVCYPYLDYFLPSIEQAELIAGTDDPHKIAKFFRDRGVKTVVIKLGSRGCYCASAQASFFFNCYRVPVVEATGAGDAFVSGFLTGVGRGKSLEDCVRLGTATAAFAVQAIGATAGIPDYETVERFINSENGLEISYDV